MSKKSKPKTEVYSVGGRRYHHVYCSVCGKYLGSTGPGEVKRPTPKEFGSMECDKCREKSKEPDTD